MLRIEVLLRLRETTSIESKCRLDNQKCVYDYDCTHTLMLSHHLWNIQDVLLSGNIVLAYSFIRVRVHFAYFIFEHITLFISAISYLDEGFSCSSKTRKVTVDKLIHIEWSVASSLFATTAQILTVNIQM